MAEQNANREAPAQSVTIDGRVHALDRLNENARQQLANIRMADLELARLQAGLALAQTARNAYVQALRAELAQDAESTTH